MFGYLAKAVVFALVAVLIGSCQAGSGLGGASARASRSAKQVDGRALGAAAVGQLGGVGVGHLDEVRSGGEGGQ